MPIAWGARFSGMVFAFHPPRQDDSLTLAIYPAQSERVSSGAVQMQRLPVLEHHPTVDFYARQPGSFLALKPKMQRKTLADVFRNLLDSKKEGIQSLPIAMEAASGASSLTPDRIQQVLGWLKSDQTRILVRDLSEQSQQQGKIFVGIYPNAQTTQP